MSFELETADSKIFVDKMKYGSRRVEGLPVPLCHPGRLCGDTGERGEPGLPERACGKGFAFSGICFQCFLALRGNGCVSRCKPCLLSEFPWLEGCLCLFSVWGLMKHTRTQVTELGRQPQLASGLGRGPEVPAHPPALGGLGGGVVEASALPAKPGWAPARGCFAPLGAWGGPGC